MLSYSYLWGKNQSGPLAVVISAHEYVTVPPDCFQGAEHLLILFVVYLAMQSSQSYQHFLFQL